MPNPSAPPLSVLLCRSAHRLYALPLAHVRETMRALPLDPLPAMPAFLLGLAMIRGTPVPVIDCARLTGAEIPAYPARYVTLALNERHWALAVDAVLGVRTIPAAALAEVTPLLDGVDGRVVQAIASLDAQLLLVLRASHMVPEALWTALAARAGAV